MLNQARVNEENSVDLLTLTLPRSVRFVIIQMTEEFCSQTIRQKSPKVAGSGPWVAM